MIARDTMHQQQWLAVLEELGVDYDHTPAGPRSAEAVAAKTWEILAYLDARGWRPEGVTLPAPAPGAYRAVLSFGGTVLRQVELYEVKP